MRSLTYIEIDVDYCSLQYGVAPCTAALGVTGAIKCFNTLKTCQDLEHFTNVPVTIRFAVDADYLPKDIEAIPSIADIGFSPEGISLGENLGERATLTVTFKDHRHSDTGIGFDKYLADRGYDPFKQGTFWGKFRARQPFLRGRNIRWITGYEGQALAEMETRHYILDSFDGPNMDGTYQLVAKDVLKLADDDRAKAPVVNTGRLLADLTAAATSCTLTPLGIGDDEYEASGSVNIGGQEICTFTRSGDVLTIVRGSAAVTHSAQDRVQQVLIYSAQTPADIVYDLFSRTEVPLGYMPLEKWQTEVNTYLNRVYSAIITDPTSVKDLLAEIIEQSALVVWWDDINQEIGLRVLRGVTATNIDFDESNIIAGSLNLSEQPDSRVSQVWTYYGQINPLLNLDEISNYRSIEVTTDLVAETEYGSPAIKVIKSRWIAQFGRTTATRLNNAILSRAKNPPRQINFSVWRGNGAAPALAAGYTIAAYPFQDETGKAASAATQITRLRPWPDRYDVEASEVLYSASADDLSNRIVTIDSNVLNFNLRTAHDTLYPPASSGDTVTLQVYAGIIAGSASTGLPAIDIGSWPSGVTINLVVQGRIQGGGGQGGRSDSPTSSPGLPGGAALYTRYPINIDVSAGEIWGGGGGGGGGGGLNGGGAGGGGGGAGTLPGGGGPSDPNNYVGSPGTATEGGIGGTADGYGTGGHGGGPGLDGLPGANNGVEPGGAGGVAGYAIDGISHVTITAGPGDIRGLEVN